MFYNCLKSAIKCKITIFFCIALLVCFKIMFLYGATIDFLLYHCHLLSV